jgi:hypothetical protein
MPINSLSAGAFAPEEIKILKQAFEKALELAHVTDRKNMRAEKIARRVISLLKDGERDPTQMAHFAAEAQSSSPFRK